MDGAADKVNKLVAGILPSQPHHLSISATQRYPAPTEFWQHNSPLQYTTYVAAGDRGVLLTRASYDIHEEVEPDAAPPTRSDSKKPVNKMSFKDYQQSKHRKFSESPPDSGPVTSMEVRPAQELHSGSQKPKLNGDNRHVSYLACGACLAQAHASYPAARHEANRRLSRADHEAHNRNNPRRNLELRAR